MDSETVPKLLSLTIAARSFSPIFLCIMTKVSPALLMASALATSRSVLEPDGIDSAQHRGSCLFPQHPPLQSLAPKSFLHKPNKNIYHSSLN